MSTRRPALTGVPPPLKWPSCGALWREMAGVRRSQAQQRALPVDPDRTASRIPGSSGRRRDFWPTSSKRIGAAVTVLASRFRDISRHLGGDHRAEVWCSSSLHVQPGGSPCTVAWLPSAVTCRLTGPRRRPLRVTLPQRAGSDGRTVSERRGACGSNPRNERTSSSGAALAHACGEHDVGYGTGRPGVLTEKAANKFGSTPPKTGG